ncbi:hypothetical protein B0I35DRAFT_428693 [Stachybotrys elegans]|uniref:Integral membrane protein n=1 Tax=Stachybotrys elegans TaxID=80388 RepID=A0A8K0WTG6_9HYPO|nr:hypothetical protein B0I35DRAFT_428693 [Stachybotrys elegans]
MSLATTKSRVGSIPQPKSALRLFLQLESVPPVLRPLVRAYLLGYVSSVAPRLLALAVKHILRRRREKPAANHDAPSFAASAAHILRVALEINRFPAFCAALAGGTALLQAPVRKLVDEFAANLSKLSRLRLARWTASFVAAWLSLRLLQGKKRSNAAPEAGSPTGSSEEMPAMASDRTLDLTLFAATRAVDVVVGELWSKHRARREAARTWSRGERLVSHLIDPLVFSASCSFIMWAWFYTPNTLPKTYAKWITSAAQVDHRLIEALQRCLKGELQYGQDTGQAALLEPMCAEYEWPLEWADPAKTIPIPCEMVHMGCGPSCEYHALSRFVRSWKWSMMTYLPISLALLVRNPSRRGLVKAIKSASRSSVFLGMFITLFYYGVCLARTRIGPHVLGKDVASRQRIDSGICVATGCFLCGWSVLFETMSRRTDMALFVAPRGLGTIVPRQYPIEKQWRETLVFSVSAAVVFAGVLENPKSVRGFLGRLLGMVMRQ